MFRRTVLTVTPDTHARHWHVLDQLAQVRHRIFVEQLGWTLPLAAGGRETDEYDDHRATYLMILNHRGEIDAAIRLHDTTGPTLLNTVFPHLVEGELPSGPGIWEGTRMLVHPDLSRTDGALAFQELLCASVAFGLSRGVTSFVSVSDPMLERVLRRAGAEPRRRGPVMEVQPGVTALALEMVCSHAVLDRLEQRLEAVLPALPRAA